MSMGLPLFEPLSAVGKQWQVVVWAQHIFQSIPLSRPVQLASCLAFYVRWPLEQTPVRWATEVSRVKTCTGFTQLTRSKIVSSCATTKLRALMALLRKITVEQADDAKIRSINKSPIDLMPWLWEILSARASVMMLVGSNSLHSEV